MKKINILFFTLITLVLLLTTVYGNTNSFYDVTKDHWAYEDIMSMSKLGITNGIGNSQFGLGKPITRAEFTGFLAKMLKWDLNENTTGSFPDNKDPNAWYFKYLEAAVKNGAVDIGQNFRPNDNITREEMAVMIVKSLGYDNIAKQSNYFESPFTDVTQNIGYINIAKDFGIISGVDENLFKPTDTATREQAAAMTMRMYNSLNNKIHSLNGFYAINSYSQKDMINSLDNVSFGWSRLDIDGSSIFLNTTTANNNEYNIPDGFLEPLGIAKNGNKKTLLMVAVQNVTQSNGKSLTSKIVTDPILRAKAIEDIAKAVTVQTPSNVAFDGAVIDFENLKGEENKQGLNIFLSELRQAIGNKLIYVAVHPKLPKGQPYYDGYDYNTIGNIADKVILMAHDYNAKSLTAAEMSAGVNMTPLAPIADVYYSIKMATDSNTGVQDKSKIYLQLSFDTAQWKSQNGKIINSTPYRPDYKKLINRIHENAITHYDKKAESPYITFVDSADNTDNIVWYEDSRSVAAKIKLAKMMNLENVSLWRIGNIPDDTSEEYYLNVWDQIIKR